MFTTDLELSVTQIIEYYGARWKIESGFKELKQDIGVTSRSIQGDSSLLFEAKQCILTRAIIDRTHTEDSA